MSNPRQNQRIIMRNHAKYIRSTLPGQLRFVGNIGIARINIKGVPRTIMAHSRIDKSNSFGGISKKFAILRKDRIFNTKKVPNEYGGVPYDRKYDTESKILEDIAARIGYNPTIRGNITLYTEKIPCSSCEYVIRQFRTRYPSIALSVYHN